MIEVRDLTKRYGRSVVVDSLSFTAEPGYVTGFLGPNGAGKSTTMRVALGLHAPTAGDVLIDGRRIREFGRPMSAVGALLDSIEVHPGRSGLNHLRWLAASNGIGRSRVDEMLDLVGLARAATKKVGGYSLGMKQRLGVAAALLGDPRVLMLDEPVNGLDPDGVRWIRELLRSLATEGRTVLISSHLMSEMELTADHLVIIGRGRLITSATIDELRSRYGRLENAYVRLTAEAGDYGTRRGSVAS